MNETCLGTVEFNGEKYIAYLENGGDVTTKSAKQIFKSTQNALKDLQKTGTRVGDLTQAALCSDGFHLQDQRIVAVEHTLSEKQIVPLQKPLYFPNPKAVNQPLTDLEHDGNGKTVFSWDEEPNELDDLVYNQPPKQTNTLVTREELVRQQEQRLMKLAGKKYDPADKTTKECIIGGTQSTEKRSAHVANYTPSDDIHDYFENNEDGSFVSVDRFAKNSPYNGLTYEENGSEVEIEGAMSAAFDRYSTQIHMLRSVEDGDGNPYCFAGRPDKRGEGRDPVDRNILPALRKAKTAVDFMFNVCFQSSEQEGIVETEDTIDDKPVYEFQFCSQQLVHAFTAPGDDQPEMFEEAVDVYQRLQKLSNRKDKPLKVQDGKGDFYYVRIKPIPIAWTQYDGAATLEALAPRSISGEVRAREASNKADDILLKIAQEKASEEEDPIKKSQIYDTMHFLEEARKGGYTHSQELMIRAYLCYLLGIPIIANCKSSVDRTSLYIALVTAMRQWVEGRGMENIPKKNGKFAIFKIIDETLPNDTTVCPFKELFAAAMHRSLKIPQMSREALGFKYFRLMAQHPALKELFPARYLRELTGTEKAKCIALFVLANILVLAAWAVTVIVLGPYELKKGGTAWGFFAPIKFAMNYRAFIPEKVLNEKADFFQGEHQLIYGKA